MITSEKLRLLDAWKDDIFGEMVISEIMKVSEKKTKTWVFNALKMMVENKLLLQQRKGNMNLYKLNLDNPLLLQTLQFVESQSSLDIDALNVVEDIINKIPLKSYCLLIFGSFAENKQKKSSDLDICFLIEDKNLEKKMRPYLKDVKLNTSLDIDEHYITYDDFKQMLLKEEENLGKQIFRKHRILFNHDIYYKLIKEVYKNGFRP